MAAADSSWLSTILASASSGMMGRILCHPLDTLKVFIAIRQKYIFTFTPSKARLQAPLGFSSNKQPLQVLTQTLREEGIRGLYR